MRVHLIAIGGAVMHNLALALHAKGFQVTGSDDRIEEPSRSRLLMAGLLPDKEGWDPERIDRSIDLVIAGMHAREDNPELIRANDLGIRVMSFPEYLFEHAKQKKRIVIGGSHGKTTITAMIMHVMKNLGKRFDYMVGAMIDGFDVMVSLSDDTDVMIFEGDEYLAAPFDRRPKFHLYKPDVALLSGIDWDHMNVFPSFDMYLDQFRIYLDLVTENGSIIYCNDDPHVQNLINEKERTAQLIPYALPDYTIENHQYIFHLKNKAYPLQVFGKHNMRNVAGALEVCKQLGINETDFFEAIASFNGAARRLEMIAEKGSAVVFRDFAHAPSKVEATVEAVREMFPRKKLIACLELHTFSSLNINFLANYRNKLNHADVPVVYYNPEIVMHKKLPPLDPERVKEKFNDDKIRVIDDPASLQGFLFGMEYDNSVLLLMSSGSFDSLDLGQLIDQL